MSDVESPVARAFREGAENFHKGSLRRWARVLLREGHPFQAARLLIQDTMNRLRRTS